MFIPTIEQAIRFNEIRNGIAHLMELVSTSPVDTESFENSPEESKGIWKTMDNSFNECEQLIDQLNDLFNSRIIANSDMEVLDK